MKRFIFLLTVSAVLFGGFNSAFAIPQAPSAGNHVGRKFLGVVVHRTEYRDDLTRVYACLIGKPHTSGRIDGITMTTADGRTFGFTDLDGVDPKRYFQWEDDGKIYIEIDFPPMDEQDGFVLQFECPDGIIKTVG